MRPVAPHASSIGGLEAKWMVLIAYLGAVVLTWIPVIGNFVSWLVPLLIFLLEKNSAFIRFHAMQSLLIAAAYFVIGTVTVATVGAAGLFAIFSLNLTAAIGAAVSAFLFGVLSLALLICQIIAIVKGFGYLAWRIPGIGILAARWSNYVGA